MRREEFCKLFNGQSLTGENLRRRQSNERPAFDLTFSAPKDLSIIYALAGPKLKREIDVAMFEAAKAGMRYVQDEACKTRLGQGGAKVVEGGGLVAALFPHDTSRELDPQYHIHALVFNFTKRAGREIPVARRLETLRAQDGGWSHLSSRACGKACDAWLSGSPRRHIVFD